MNRLLFNLEFQTGSFHDILPTDIGSRIGIMYVPTSAREADMHFIINGEDQGACTRNIPFASAPLHVVVDVYGATKQVRIIQLYGGKCNFYFRDKKKTQYTILIIIYSTNFAISMPRCNIATHHEKCGILSSFA